MIASITIFLVALLRERGFDGFQIGTILAVRAFATITIQPVIASFADKHADQIPLKYIMCGMLGICLFANLLLLFIPFNFIGMLTIFIIFGGTENSLAGFNDSLAMQFLNIGRKINYSFGRGIGSISFAVVCVGLGYFVDVFGLESILVIHCVLLVIYFVTLITFEKSSDHSISTENEQKPHSIFYLLRSSRGFTLFLLASVLIFTGSTMSSSFLIDIVKNLGGTNKDLGFTLFIVAASELPMALLFSRIRVRLGIKRILKYASFFMFVKIVCILFAPNITILIMTQTLQMLGFGAYMSASVLFVNENMSCLDRIKGQTLMQLSSSGFGAGVGALLGGAIVNQYGLASLLYFASIIAFIGVLIMFAAMHSNENQNSPI